jgi:tRNA (guanine6-N2)-methyltransferase
MRGGDPPSRAVTWEKNHGSSRFGVWGLGCLSASWRRCDGMTAARLVARTLRGIEHLAADEIRDRCFGAIDWIGHREVHLTVSDPVPAVAALRTADDVLLVAAVVDDPGRTKGDLRRLVGALRSVDVRRLLRLRRLWSGTSVCAGVDVSASFVGRRAFNRFDVEDIVGEHLARVMRVEYHSRRHGDRPPAGTWAWRVTLDGSRATIALRIGERPAHRRAYKRGSVAGTLHPPLAAAMVRLAEVRPGTTVLDPCCGAATLLMEAVHTVPGARVLGLDHDSAALRVATVNTWGEGLELLQADAGRLPLAAGSVDRILVNPPWGRQVPARGLLARRPDRLWAEARRVLQPRGRLVALLHGDDAQIGDVIGHGFAVMATHTVRLSGAIATVVSAV